MPEQPADLPLTVVQHAVPWLPAGSHQQYLDRRARDGSRCL